MTRILITIALVPFLYLLAVPAQANIASVGTLSYDTFIPGSSGFPGVDAFNLSNLSGGFSLPADFPVTDSLTFQSARLTLTFSDLSQEVFNLGDIGPGFLLDPSGNPVVQVPSDQLFASAEFTATLSPGSFALFNGTSFVADSTSLDVLLQPSSGPTLGAPAIIAWEPTSLRRIARRPQHYRRGLFVGHPLRVADRLHLQAPGR